MLCSQSAQCSSPVDSPVLESSDQPLLFKQTKQSQDDNWVPLEQRIAPEQINSSLKVQLRG